MFVVRPVEPGDLPQLEALARRGNRRVHTLPACPRALARQVSQSEASFAGSAGRSAERRYTFVLDAGGALAGTASILAQAGAGEHFFAFRQDYLHQGSGHPEVNNDAGTLRMCADLSAYSQLSTFHAPGAQLRGRQKSLLARARLMYAALAPQRFADRFFASLPGHTSRDNTSPFWDAIGRNFFGMDFLQAEALLEGARNRPLLAGLMPHHPVYVALLPNAARAAIASVDPAANDARALLQGEGFEALDYIDVCDGGAVLQASRHAIRTCATSFRRRLGPAPRPSGAVRPYLVCNAREQGFRALEVFSEPNEQSLHLTSTQRRQLDVVDGDELLCVRM